MITDHPSTAHKVLLLPSLLLQNTPVPSEDSRNTLTRDYDQKRFYRQPMKGSSGQGDVSAHIILTRGRAYDQLRVRLNELNLQYTVGHEVRYTVRYEPMTECVADALINWISTSSLEWNTASIEFKFHKADISHDLLRFCFKHGVVRYLLVTLDIVDQFFPQIEELSMSQEQDPEMGDEWITIDISIRGEIDEVLEKYNKYTDQFITSIPWPERSKIRLSYNVI